MAMISGVAITLIGYYVPFMIASTIVASIGMGVLSTLKPDSGSPTWIGYEALFGLGIGAGLMQMVLIAQTVLSDDDIATGTATLIFFQTMGGAIMVRVAWGSLVGVAVLTQRLSDQRCSERFSKPTSL